MLRVSGSLADLDTLSREMLAQGLSWLNVHNMKGDALSINRQGLS